MKKLCLLLATLTTLSAAAERVVRLTPSDNPLEVFKSINGAHEAVTLEVEPGVYWLDDPDDPAVRAEEDGSIPYGVVVECDTLRMVGLAENPEDIVFAVNRGQTRGAVGNYTMFNFRGKSLEASNITFGNYCNIDLVYPRDPSKNRVKRAEAIVQAQIGICSGTDRVFMRNCRFLSRLNLCPFVGGRRSLYVGCYFESTDDALTGSAVYLSSRFKWFSSKPFYSTDRTGAVLLDCDVELSGASPQYVTKAPGMVTIIDTRFTAPTEVELEWCRWTSPVACYQSNVTLNGRPVRFGGDRTVDLTDKPLLEAYKADGQYNIANLMGGLDGWNPLCSSTAKVGIPVRFDFGEDKIQISALGETASLPMVFRLWGDYEVSYRDVARRFPLILNWTFPTTVKVEQVADTVIITNNNHYPQERTDLVTANVGFGWRGGVDVALAPYLTEAPKVVAPSLSVKHGLVSLSYKIDADDDKSEVTWYRVYADGDTIPVRHGPVSRERSYKLTGSDRGTVIGAKLTPKGYGTEAAAPVFVKLERPVAERQIPKEFRGRETRYKTDFSEVPVYNIPLKGVGQWAFDCYKPKDTEAFIWEPSKDRSWYYGRATDDAPGVGLVEAVRGARAFYVPDVERCGGMSAEVVLQPCKGAGQGFGSATGQYLDIYVQYNPATQTGYGLRVERTVDYDHAVVFRLMKFTDGISEPISESVAGNCYRSNCYVKLKADSGTLSAEVYSDNPAAADRIALSTPVETKDRPAAFGLQHTGTTGASATLVRDVSLSWY